MFTIQAIGNLIQFETFEDEQVLAVSFDRGQTDQRKKAIFSNLIDCYLLTGWEPPEDDVLKAKVELFAEKLRVPLANIEEAFDLAREHREIPSATLVSKAFRENILPRLIAERKRADREAETIAGAVADLELTLERLTLNKRFDLNGLSLLSKEAVLVYASNDYKQTAAEFRELFCFVRELIEKNSRADITFAHKVIELCKRRDLSGKDLAEVLPAQLLKEFSKFA